MSEILENSDELTEDINSEKYLIFSIFDRLYSFPSRHIGEITMFDTVYPLPLVPPYVLGVINRYSTPYALFDIELLLNPQRQNQGDDTFRKKKVLVLKDDIDRIAFLIDDVSDITDIPEKQIMDVERNIQENDLTEAVSAAFDWNDNKVFVLDIHKILERITESGAYGGKV